MSGEMIKIATLFTAPLEDHTINQIGEFSLAVFIDRAMFLKAYDKPGLAKRQIAAYLASAILDTQVPVEYWRATCEPEFVKNMNLPKHLNFGVR